MVYRWQWQTTTVISDSRVGSGPRPRRIPEQATLSAPTISEAITEEGTAQNTTCGCFHTSGNIPTLLLPLPNALGTAHMLDHCLFLGPCNKEQSVQHLLGGLSRMGCTVCGLQGVMANHSYFL